MEEHDEAVREEEADEEDIQEDIQVHTVIGRFAIHH